MLDGLGCKIAGTPLSCYLIGEQDFRLEKVTLLGNYATGGSYDCLVKFCKWLSRGSDRALWSVGILKKEKAGSLRPFYF